MTAAESARRWCEEIGGDGCLPKPFDLDELYGLVERFCGKAGWRPEGDDEDDEGDADLTPDEEDGGYEDLTLALS
jgi:hypothetical protein